MLDTNVTGVLRVTGAFSDDLVRAAADGRTADIVNVSSIGAHVVFPDYAVYSASKAAVTHLSQVLRTEYGPRDVRVTNVEPGFVESELIDRIEDGRLAREVGAMRDAVGALSAGELADVVAYTVSRPRRVNLRQIVVLPTRQV